MSRAHDVEATKPPRRRSNDPWQGSQPGEEASSAVGPRAAFRVQPAASRAARTHTSPLLALRTCCWLRCCFAPQARTHLITYPPGQPGRLCRTPGPKGFARDTTGQDRAPRSTGPLGQSIKRWTGSGPGCSIRTGTETTSWARAHGRARRLERSECYRDLLADESRLMDAWSVASSHWTAR